jgi:ribonuclease HI
MHTLLVCFVPTFVSLSTYLCNSCLPTYVTVTSPLQSWTASAGNLQEVVAAFLAVPKTTISIAPHPWLNRMAPLWVGKRRWTQSRKMYKRLINAQRDRRAEKARKEIQDKLAQGFPAEAKALAKLDWKQIHKMEGVSPYMTQTIMRFKSNRLRLWTTEENGFRCLAQTCGATETQGNMHLGWACPEAQLYWEEYLRRWGRETGTGPDAAASRRAAMNDVLGFRLPVLPAWLARWGQQEYIHDWSAMHKVVRDLWKLGIAVVLTAIWRRNIDRGYPDGRRTRTLAESISGAMDGVAESYERYRLGRLPLTSATLIPIQTTEQLLRHWRHIQPQMEDGRHWLQPVRIGFFDGGSRGNPGPGGSGSVIIQKEAVSGGLTVAWAAATALSCPTMTNNVAEFVGLHRLLAHVAEKGWTRIHVVGDSAMILRLMRTRTETKARKLKHWYSLTSKLAGICQVASWSHHYRAHNKMADGLANVAMDEKRSKMVTFTEGDHDNSWMRWITKHLDGDVTEWERTHAQRGESE